MLIVSHRACQKSALTAKIRLWDPVVCSTRGLKVLLRLWLMTKSPLDCGVREQKLVSRFSL
jgi:hypothetical protein